MQDEQPGEPFRPKAGGEGRPAGAARRNAHGAAMCLGDPSGDRQPESRAASSPHGVEPDEALEARSRSSAGMPGPVSAIRKTACPSALESAICTAPPGGV